MAVYKALNGNKKAAPDRDGLRYESVANFDEFNQEEKREKNNGDGDHDLVRSFQNCGISLCSGLLLLKKSGLY